jgi:hypothetical protein
LGGSNYTLDHVDYYTGEPNNGSSNNFQQDDFAIDARDLFNNNQQPQQYSPYFTTGPGYVGPGANGVQITNPNGNTEYFVNKNFFDKSPQEQAFRQQQMMQQTPPPMNPPFGYAGNPYPYNNGYNPQQTYYGQPMGYQQPYNGQQMNYNQNVSPAMGLLYQNQQQYNYGQQQQYYNGPQLNAQGQPMGVGNPAFNNSYWNGQSWQPTNSPFNTFNYHDRVVHVPGYNPGGNSMLLPGDIQEQFEDMCVQMMLDETKAEAERRNRTQGYFNNNYGGYYNYYGFAYAGNNGLDSSVVAKYKQKVSDIREKAEKRRLDFNKNLSALCHNYLQDGTTQEQIDSIYEGYTYTIPGAKLQEYDIQDYLGNLKEYDPSLPYKIADAQATADFKYVCPPGRNMNEFFEDLGLMKTVELLAEERHRRRDTTNYYAQDAYKARLVKYAQEHMGEPVREQVKTDYMSQFNMENPTKGSIIRDFFGKEEVDRMANNGITIDDNGTMNITTPDWILNKMRSNNTNPEPVIKLQSPMQPQPVYNNTGPVVNNQLESEFDKNRERFLQSIYDKSIT